MPRDRLPSFFTPVNSSRRTLFAWLGFKIKQRKQRERKESISQLLNGLTLMPAPKKRVRSKSLPNIILCK